MNFFGETDKSLNFAKIIYSAGFKGVLTENFASEDGQLCMGKVSRSGAVEAVCYVITKEIKKRTGVYSFWVPD